MSKHDDPAVESLTTDLAFDLLRDGTRRRVVAALRESEGAMALDELAAEAVARGEGVAPEAVSADRRKRTAASLHHCHLPKLEEADVAAYDPVANQVEAARGVEELAPYFEVIDAEEAGTVRRD